MPTTVPLPVNLIQTGWSDYALLDSGDGRKLERFGSILLDRPEAEAVWSPGMSQTEWKKADAYFVTTAEENGGHWKYRTSFPTKWTITRQGLTVWVQTSPSRHVGVFPEQAPQWDWLMQILKNSQPGKRVLNLFGYTGMSTLAAAQAGAKVTHLDASKRSIQWAKENAFDSKIPETCIRWILDDALKFAEREQRRGSQYDGIILDPPKFGRGPKGEVWEFYRMIPSLLQACRGILSPDPLFVLMTAYAIKASYLTLYHAMGDMMLGFQGRVEAGELVNVDQSSHHALSMAIYASWYKE